jgi:hypothetical protein
MRYLLALLPALLAVSAAFGQDLGVILMNAQDEHTSCITKPKTPLPSTVCGDTINVRLGRTVELVVLNRHFLTNYSVDVGEGVDLHEPGPVGPAVSPVRFVTGAAIPIRPPVSIDRKTSVDFLGLLLDVTTSPEAVAEVEREDQLLDLDLRRIKSDVDAFDQEYALVVGSGSVLVCDPNQSQRTGIWVEACLHGQFDVAEANEIQNENEFRVLVKTADGLFTQAQSFGADLTAADFASRGRQLEAAIVAYQDDLRSFRWNLNAAQGAVWMVKKLVATPGEPLLSLQIRAQLRRQLGAEGVTAGSSKPALDEAETNEQIDRYFKLLRSANSIPQFWREKLGEKIAGLLTTKGGDPAAQEISSLDGTVEDIHDKVQGALPRLVSEINDWQLRLAARIDEIYEKSAVPITESDFGLDKMSSNGVVSYRILRTTEFEPYQFGPSIHSRASQPSEEVSRGAFAVTDTENGRPKRTVWQILRLTH